MTNHHPAHPANPADLCSWRTSPLVTAHAAAVPPTDVLGSPVGRRLSTPDTPGGRPVPCRRLQRVLGLDHPDVLTTRNNIAYWAGEAGDARRALELFKELLPDQERVLRPDHPDVLRTQNWIRHLKLKRN
jgi:Tetratricopeptide repeat